MTPGTCACSATLTRGAALFVTLQPSRRPGRIADHQHDRLPFRVLAARDELIAAVARRHLVGAAAVEEAAGQGEAAGARVDSREAAAARLLLVHVLDGERHHATTAQQGL